MPARRPGYLTGALVGAFLTAPLVALFYFGWKALGLPFVPFNLFDWTTRVLPGPVVTFGIDSMVVGIRALGFADTATAAKTAEQSMAIVLFLIAGLVAGALLFTVLRAVRAHRAILAGIAVGLAFGVGAVLVMRTLGRPEAVPASIGGLWTLFLFVSWGAALGLAWRRLSFGDATLSPSRVEESLSSVERVDRRRFLVRLGAATATVTVVGAVVGSLVGSRRGRSVGAARRWSADNPLPNAGADVAPVPGTRPEFTPLEDHYRIDISTIPPVVDGASWRLKVGGLVEKPLELTVAQIRSYEPLHQFVTLACISNPVGGGLTSTTRWTGVSLQRLLPDLRLDSRATHLKLTSADKFFELVPLETIRADERVMLAYDWDGVPLATKHGFPLRIYIPDLYGMKQPKWIVSMEATDRWEPGYWVKRGWDREARMKATSVIDAVSVDMMLSEADANTRIPLGGIAHAGARGISQVEVRVDDGPWTAARLRAPLSATTWVVWRYDWPFRAGDHTFTVRCFDGAGAPQIVAGAPPHPSGSAGLHTKTMML